MLWVYTERNRESNSGSDRRALCRSQVPTSEQEEDSSLVCSPSEMGEGRPRRATHWADATPLYV